MTMTDTAHQSLNQALNIDFLSFDSKNNDNETALIQPGTSQFQGDAK
jgi:hypothetical protein